MPGPPTAGPQVVRRDPAGREAAAAGPQALRAGTAGREAAFVGPQALRWGTAGRAVADALTGAAGPQELRWALLAEQRLMVLVPRLAA